MPIRAREAVSDIVVVSPLRLLAETVRAALASCALDAVALPWASDAERDLTLARLVEGVPGTLVLVLEVPSRGDVMDARSLVSTSGWRSVAVLGGRVEGPAWGALLDAGVQLVLPASVSFIRVMEAVSDLDLTRSSLDEKTRGRLVASWREAEERDASLATRMARLTPREMSVLMLLHAGTPVGGIAATTGLAEWTVRGHLKSLRRKLGVDSQMAAIAAYERFSQGGEEPW